MTLPWGSWCTWAKLGADARQGAGKRLELDCVCDRGWKRQEGGAAGLALTKTGLATDLMSMEWCPWAPGWGSGGQKWENYSAPAHRSKRARWQAGTQTGYTGNGHSVVHIWGGRGFWAAHVEATWGNLGQHPEGLTLTWGLTNVICGHLVIINGNAN